MQKQNAKICEIEKKYEVNQVFKTLVAFQNINDIFNKKHSITQSGHIFQMDDLIITQNTNNRRLRIWKNKCIIEFNKQPTKY